RHPVYGARALVHAQRRHALWREPRCGWRQRSHAQRRRGQSGPRAWPAHRRPGGEAGLMPPLPASRKLLAGLLLALAALFAAWFAGDARYLQALAVFAAPPLLLAVGVLARRRTAPFWASVLALAWFCHGVMLAWERADGRAFALAEVALALGIVFAASWPALVARSAGRAARADRGNA